MSDLPDEPTSAARGASEQIVFHKRLESRAHEFDGKPIERLAQLVPEHIVAVGRTRECRSVCL